MGIILEGNYINMLSDSSGSLEKNQKQEEYMDYIEGHRNRVQEAYEKYFIPLIDQDIDLNSCSNEEFQIGLKEAQSNIAIHDESKYSNAEFDAYRLRFYPTTEESEYLQSGDAKIQQQQDFEDAWEHHYKNNPHHPKYWVQEDGSIRDMDIKYIIEMLCDWLSFGGDIRVWYANKADVEKKCMTIRTKEITEELMELIYTRQVQ